MAGFKLKTGDMAGWKAYPLNLSNLFRVRIRSLQSIYKNFLNKLGLQDWLMKKILPFLCFEMAWNSCFVFIGIIHLVCTQNFPKNYYFLLPHTHTQGVRNISFLENLAHVLNEWSHIKVNFKRSTFSVVQTLLIRIFTKFCGTSKIFQKITKTPM